MTKEEFAELKTADTQFLTTFYKIYAHFYDDFKEEKIKTVLETPVGNYLWKISLAISEINQNFADIRFIREMLLACDPKNKPLRKKLIRLKLYDITMKTTFSEHLRLKTIVCH